MSDTVASNNFANISFGPSSLTTSISGTSTPLAQTYYTINSSFDGLTNPWDDFLRLFVLSHDEKEIDESLTKIKSICVLYEDNRVRWETIVRDVLKTKHFSEEFILSYIDEIKDNNMLKEAILEHHAGDIYSNKYASLALKILAEK